LAELRIRDAANDDAEAVAELLHLTAVDMYERFAGDRDSSLRLLDAAFGRSGNGASREVIRVADAAGGPAGVMAAFPAAEITARGRRFVRLLLWRTPPWTWRRSLRLYRLGMGLAPPPPPESYYVDALATGERHRRRGVAAALLEDAERRARELGLPSLALETAVGNAGARALYEACGFVVSETRRARAGLPGFVAYVKPL
jgi:ribosomal protein S18 acetylase RimI-like enzyme